MVKMSECVSWMDTYIEYNVGIVIEVEKDYYGFCDKVKIYWPGLRRFTEEPAQFIKEIK